MHSNKKYMKIYLTKYALTVGIQEKKVTQSTTSENTVIDKTNGYTNFYHKKDWYLDKEEAVKVAEGMRLNKIALLKKSITKLENLKF